MYVIKITTPKSENILYLKSIRTYSSSAIYFEVTTDFKSSHDFKTLDTARKVVSLFDNRDSGTGSEYSMTICKPQTTLVDVDDSDYKKTV